MMRRAHRLSFGTYLAGLVFLATIPVVALAMAVVRDDVGRQRVELAALLRSSVHVAADALEFRLADAVTSLRALSEGTRPPTGNPDAFAAAARVLLAGHPLWQSITLMSSAGQPLATIALPAGMAAASRNGGYVPAEMRAIPSHQTVLVVPVAPSVRACQVAIGVPVVLDGGAIGALWVRLMPGMLRRYLAAQRILPTWTAAIMDSRGVVLAATDPALPGHPFPFPLSRPEAGAPGPFLATRRTGSSARVDVVLARSTASGWTLAYVAPLPGLLSPGLYRSTKGLVLAGVIALPLLLAILIGRSLQGQVRDLAEAAAAVSREDEHLPGRPSGVTEIDEVRETLAQALEVLAARRVDRERLHEAEVMLLRAQRAEVISHLTSTIAHDYGNLALAISSRLELIRQQLGDHPQVRPLIDPTLQLVAEAGRMMSDLTTAGRTQAMPAQRTQVNEVIQETTELLRHVAGRGVRLKVQLAPGLWDCVVNPTMLKSAVFNLVVNARAAMPEGGTLWLLTRNVTIQPRPPGAEAPRPGPYVLLAVTDTGTGIPEATLERIFDPFFTTRRDANGAGLGLAMVREFVIQAGGDIRVTSRIGVGTTFFLYLPRAPQGQDRGPPVVLAALSVNHDSR